MACKEFLHSKFTDDEGLHEPKGHKTAVIHSSLASNGDGTTFWRQDRKDIFTPSNGQTVFVLAFAPLVDNYFAVWINGHDHTDEFSLSGSTLTYIGIAFVLESTDRIEVRYRT